MGVALEVGSITQGLASSMTAKYTGPTTKGTNTREYRVKFYRHKRKQIEYRKITNTKLKEVNIIFSIPSKYLKYNIDKKNELLLIYITDFCELECIYG